MLNGAVTRPSDRELCEAFTDFAEDNRNPRTLSLSHSLTQPSHWGFSSTAASLTLFNGRLTSERTETLAPNTNRITVNRTNSYLRAAPRRQLSPGYYGLLNSESWKHLIARRTTRSGRRESNQQRGLSWIWMAKWPIFSIVFEIRTDNRICQLRWTV